MIPEESLLHHMAVLGKTGSGKTYTAKAEVVEPLLDVGRQVAIVDPTSAWWGLRLQHDGKTPSRHQIILLGGPHGDLALTENMGAACARLITEQLASVVLDTSLMTVGERTRWFTGFAVEIYRTIRQPLTLVLDEVHNFCPQGKVPDPATGKMLHAANQLFSGGRSRGIRLVGISQRPAKWHKDALTSVDTLVVHRMLAPQDRDAVKAWIDGCGDAKKGREVLDSLAGLQRGEAWVWFPEGDVLRRGRSGRIRTFDSSATPDHGSPVAVVQAIDLGQVKAALAEAAKEAEANDPKHLRARIEQLEDDLAAALAGGEPDPDANGTSAMLAEIERLEADLARARDDLINAADWMRYRRELIVRAIQKLKEAEELMLDDSGILAGELVHPATPPPDAGSRSIRLPPPRPSPPPPTVATRANGANPAPSRSSPESSAAEGFSGPESRILSGIAACAGFGLNRPPRTLVAACARYSPTSTSFTKAQSSLRVKGMIEYPDADSVTFTAAGRKSAPRPAAVRSLAELHGQILAILTGPERRILEALLKAGPRSMQRATAAERSGYSVTSTSFTKAQSSLRSKGFVDYPNSDTIEPTAALFPAGLK